MAGAKKINARVVGFALGALSALGAITLLLLQLNPQALVWQPGDIVLFLMLSSSAILCLVIATIALEPGIPDQP